MSTELVTGGAGFIGGWYVRRRLESGCRLVVIDKLTYAASVGDLPASDRLTFVQGDIGDAPLVADLLRRFQIDRVVNFAAETHVDRSIDSPLPFVETNVAATCRLLEAVRHYWSDLSPAARDAFRFLHVSTDEVFGELGPTGQFTDSSPYAPRSPYAASKAAADHFVRAYQATYGLPAIITNGSNNFGPYQFPEKLIPLLILNAVEGRPLPIYGDGSQVRDWMYVEDHCLGLQLALERGEPGQTYLFGGGNERTNLQVAEAVCDLVDQLRPQLAHAPCRQLIQFVEDRPGHDARYAIDSRKAQRDLGWQPTSNWLAHLEATVRWYLDHPEWVAQRHYDRQRLGQLRRSE